jgi:hypothetical protein
MEDDLKFQEMEDDLNFSGNGIRPQFFRKWKTTSASGNVRKPQLQKMEDNINFSGNER